MNIERILSDETIDRYHMDRKLITTEDNSLAHGLLVKSPDGYPDNKICVYTVKDAVSKLCTEYDNSYFIIIALWLATYGQVKSYPDPVPDRWSGISVEDLRLHLDLFREGIHSHNEYLERLKKADIELAEYKNNYNINYSYLDIETFNGEVSQSKTLTGGVPEYRDPGYRVIMQNDESSWDLHTKNRGTLDMEVRFHDKPAMYQYLLYLRMSGLFI